MFQGSPHQNLKALHDKYGSVVRFRPDSLSFNSPGAWKGWYFDCLGKRRFVADGEQIFMEVILERDSMLRIRDLILWEARMRVISSVSIPRQSSRI